MLSVPSEAPWKIHLKTSKPAVPPRRQSAAAGEVRRQRGPCAPQGHREADSKTNKGRGRSGRVRPGAADTEKAKCPSSYIFINR